MVFSKGVDDWEVVEDEETIDQAQIDLHADELRQKMRELVANMDVVIEAVIEFNSYYAQVFEADEDGSILLPVRLQSLFPSLSFICPQFVSSVSVRMWLIRPL